MDIPSWLNNAVFYEIYPQSFYDSNGDGIGDLPGIIAKLDYVKSLGVTAIWLNPCFESPFQDAGYDISDFYKIAPRYGTNEDMRCLCIEAHKRNLKIVLDLVAGHTSIEHPWFKDSCKGPGTTYSNYYMWTNGWGDKVGYNRYVSGYAERDGFYITNFFYCQPALNYGFYPPDPECKWQLPVDHPDVLKVRNELKNIMKFWLDMGCDGFRVDMAPSLVRGENAQEGLNELWHNYRAWLNENYPEAVLISEWSNPQLAIPAGFHVDFKIHCSCPGYCQLFRAEKERVGNGMPIENKHSFFDRSGQGDASEFIQEIIDDLNVISGKGYLAVPTGNHDMGRIRGGRLMEEMRAIYAFILMLPGVPFIYYGDEIGMNNVFGLGNKEGSYNRSVSRTPMQWTAEETGGFSSANPDKFYLPLDSAIDRPNVASQENDPESLLNFTRRLIAIRLKTPALCADGGFRKIFCEKNVYPLIFERYTDNDSWIIAVNPSGIEKSAIFSLPDADKYKPIETSNNVSLELLSGATKITLPQSGYAIFRKKL